MADQKAARPDPSDNTTMQCVEKEDLQRQCSTAWSDYQIAAEKLGLPVDMKTGAALPGSLEELRMLKAAGMLNSRTVTMTQPYLAVITLRQGYLKASQALSRHLSAHRC
jgi:hypothetical protein